MTKVLEGIKVIEMGHFVAVPTGAAMLADWGAEVIKIEPLAGEAMRFIYVLKPDFTIDADGVNYRFEVHNRNKKSVALDVSKDRGREILLRFIEKADVFVSNYQPAVLRKFRLQYSDLERLNPGLVYASLTGFGTQGAEKDERGFDATAGWARTGIQYLLADGDGPPPMVVSGLMDRVAASNVVAGILAALLSRTRTGKGQEIQVSLYNTGAWAIAADIQMALTGNQPIKNDRANRINPLANVYRTKDHRWIQLAMMQPHLHWHDFCRAIDRTDLEQDMRFSPEQLDIYTKNRAELIRIIDEVFTSATLSEWEERLQRNNCIFSRVWTPQEVVVDPQARSNEMFLPVEYPGVGTTELLCTPVRFPVDPISVKMPAPHNGQHTEEELLELGYSWDDINKFKDEHTIL